MHSVVPDTLHVPTQGNIPHQRVQRSQTLWISWHSHHHLWAQLHRDHWWKQEGVVYLRHVSWGAYTHLTKQQESGRSLRTELRSWTVCTGWLVSVVVGWLRSALHINCKLCEQNKTLIRHFVFCLVLIHINHFYYFHFYPLNSFFVNASMCGSQGCWENSPTVNVITAN